MKVLNSIQELWSYCLYCPICKDVCREITISPRGYADIGTISSDGKFLKDNEFLKFKIQLYVSNEIYTFNFNVNCLLNTFDVLVTGPSDFFKYFNKKLYFNIDGMCKNGCFTFANSSKIMFDFKNKTISDIGIEEDGACIKYGKDEFQITRYYGSNLLEIWDVSKDADQYLTIDLFNVDFSDIKKLIHRIKTIITFS